MPWVTFIDGAGGISSQWQKQLSEFKLHYNVLVLDIAQGENTIEGNEDLNIDAITNAILGILDFKNIPKSHFIGVSLGTVFIRNLAEKYPNRIKSMVLAGAIVKLSFRFRTLLQMRAISKSFFSSKSLFKFFVFLLLPNKNNRESRSFFIEQSQGWKKGEFNRWAQLTSKLKPVLKYLNSGESNVPTLYIMGEEDYLFLPTVKRISSENSGKLLFVIQDCGHFVNLEQPILFNKMVIGYLVGTENRMEDSLSVEDSFNNCSPEEVLIANSNNHSKK